MGAFGCTRCAGAEVALVAYRQLVPAGWPGELDVGVEAAKAIEAVGERAA